MITNLPNLLTLSRIAVIPLVIACFYLPQPWASWLSFALFAAAGITDWLDGWVARRWGQVSAFGRFLDPIADKLLVSIALMMLVAVGRLPMPVLLPALVILAREIMVSGLREFLATLRLRIPVSRLAKWKTAIQMGAIGCLLVGDEGPAALPVTAIGQGMLWAAAILTLITGYDYLRAGLIHMSAHDAPGATAPANAAEAMREVG
jgi:cardiolipin synthase